ncbi:MAG: hypothetical protein NTZ73_02460 [Candidatus Diapherotrites archaeon]|nr:hypothetical protein [Candidatus Diapherotrites archaeon]
MNPAKIAKRKKMPMSPLERMRMENLEGERHRQALLKHEKKIYEARETQAKVNREDYERMLLMNEKKKQAER